MTCERQVHPTIYGAMVRKVRCVAADAPLVDAIEKMEKSGYDQVPVVEDHVSGKLVGVVSTRHLMNEGINREKALAHSLLASEGAFNPFNVKGMVRRRNGPIGKSLLNYYHVHDFLIVVGPGDRVVGIVQLWDIARELWNASR